MLQDDKEDTTRERSQLSQPSIKGVSCRWCQFGRHLRRVVTILVTGCLVVSYAFADADPPLQVGSIQVQLQDIFAYDEVAVARGINRLLRRSMNAAHVTTREWVVRSELLFDTGDPYDPALLAESERNLRAAGFLSHVAVTAIDTTADGRVNVLVTTKESWTLEAGVSFAVASSDDQRWRVTLADENFIGYGFELLAAVGQVPDADYTRLGFRMNRFLHTPLTVDADFDNRSDGYNNGLRITVPFRAADQTWAANFQVQDQDIGVRWYLSNGGPAGTDPAADDRLYAVLPRHWTGVNVGLQRRISPVGRGRVWRLGLGLNVTNLRYDITGSSNELSDGRFVDLSFLDEPGEPMDRATGTEVWPYLTVASVGREWVKTCYLLRYGSDEDIPLAPAFRLQLGPSGPQLGSTSGEKMRMITTVDIRNWDQFGRTFLVQWIDGTAVVGRRDDRYHKIDAMIGSYVRFGPQDRPFTLKTFVEGIHSDRWRGDKIAVLGLDRGLRTLGLDGMAGEKMLRWSTEIGRTTRWELLDLLRTGWGLYYGAGIATWNDETRDLGDVRHEAGVGLRLGFSRSSGSPLARIDLTRDLSGEDGWVVTTVSSGFF